MRPARVPRRARPGVGALPNAVAIEWARLTPPEGEEVVVREVGGGYLDLSQHSLAVARLPTTHISPLPTTQAPLSIRVGNQHSFVKAN